MDCKDCIHKTYKSKENEWDNDFWNNCGLCYEIYDELLKQKIRFEEGNKKITDYIELKIKNIV